MTIRPGSYSWYPSSLCGPYYAWFVAMNYPNLDILEHQDGAWSVIEYYNSPVVPSLTRWNYVLSDIRNTIPTYGFVQKYIQQLDLRRREVWDACEARDRAQDDEKARLNQHAQDTAERAKNVIMQTPSLVERIGKNGLQEMNLDKIVKHIPDHQLNGHRGPT